MRCALRSLPGPGTALVSVLKVTVDSEVIKESPKETVSTSLICESDSVVRLVPYGEYDGLMDSINFSLQRSGLRPPEYNITKGSYW